MLCILYRYSVSHKQETQTGYEDTQQHTEESEAEVAEIFSCISTEGGIVVVADCRTPE